MGLKAPDAWEAGVLKLFFADAPSESRLRIAGCSNIMGFPPPGLKLLDLPEACLNSSNRANTEVDNFGLLLGFMFHVEQQLVTVCIVCVVSCYVRYFC